MHSRVNTIFFAATADAEDNVTQQLSDPDNDNSNLTRAAESKSENHLMNQLSKINRLPLWVRQTQKTSIHHHHFRMLCINLSLVIRINSQALYLMHHELISAKEDLVEF